MRSQICATLFTLVSLSMIAASSHAADVADARFSGGVSAGRAIGNLDSDTDPTNRSVSVNDEELTFDNKTLTGSADIYVALTNTFSGSPAILSHAGGGIHTSANAQLSYAVSLGIIDDAINALGGNTGARVFVRWKLMANANATGEMTLFDVPTPASAGSSAAFLLSSSSRGILVNEQIRACDNSRDDQPCNTTNGFNRGSGARLGFPTIDLQPGEQLGIRLNVSSSVQGNVTTLNHPESVTYDGYANAKADPSFQIDPDQMFEIDGVMRPATDFFEIVVSEGVASLGPNPEGSGGQPFASVLPAGRFVAVGGTATVFASILNAGDSMATGCSPYLESEIPAEFTFRQTDPATNAISSPVGEPADIAPGATQSYLLQLQPSASFDPTDVSFIFTCSDTGDAPTLSGINTLQLGAADLATADVVALGATAQNDGILRLDNGGAFSVATVNVGVSDNLTITADTGTADLGLTLSLCQTDPVSGDCLAPPVAAEVGTALDIAADATPTFAVFAFESESIALDPAASRVYVRFHDGAGALRGATSVAVTTL